ncbi:hypothetical protein ACO0QE_000939 [Hanseniaspora vineae]
MLDTSKYTGKVLPGDLICPVFDLDTEDTNILYEFLPGHGSILDTYKAPNGQSYDVLVASLKGYVEFEEFLTPKEDIEETSEQDPVNTNDGKGQDSKRTSDRTVKKYNINVVAHDPFVQSSGSIEQVNNDFSNNLPKENDIVLCKITKITQQRANAEILAVENRPCVADSGLGTNGSVASSVTGGSGAVTFSISQVSSDVGETFKAVIRSQDVRATDRDSVVMTDCFCPGDIVRCKVLSLGDGTNYYLTTAQNDLGVVFAKSLGGAGELMYAVDWKTMVAPTSGVAETRKVAKPF